MSMPDDLISGEQAAIRKRRRTLLKVGIPLVLIFSLVALVTSGVNRVRDARARTDSL